MKMWSAKWSSLAFLFFDVSHIFHILLVITKNVGRINYKMKKMSKNDNLNEKHFLSVEKQIKLLENRGLSITNLSSLQWYLTKYNYQSFINGYNDFFLVDGARKWNIYKKNANSDDLIKLFNFDRNISKFILGDIQNIERFLQNAIVQTFSNTFSKWKDRTNISIEDMNNLSCGRILMLSEETWNLIFANEITKHFKSNKEKQKPKPMTLKEEIINKLEREEHSKLVAKYSKNFFEMPIWSIIIFLDFGTLIRIMRSFNTICFDYAIEYFQEKLRIKYKMNKDEFNSIFYLIKEVRNKICHSNVLFNYDNKSNQVISVNGFLRKNNFIVKDVNRIRFFDLVRLIFVISKNFDSTLQSFTLIAEKVKEIRVNTNNSQIFEEILKFMHFEELLENE